MDVMEMARAERADLADLLDTLTPEQWDHPSLCTRWRVRDVVAHAISYEESRPADLGRWLVRARFDPDRLSDIALARYRDRSPAELAAFLRDHLTPRGATALFGGKVGLVDLLVHHQDVRRPLGLPRVVPTDRLAVALPFAVTSPPLRGFWHGRGVRLVAEDLGWATGRGPEARGPGEAVLMVLSGRAGAARDLTGPGVDVLRRRLG